MNRKEENSSTSTKKSDNVKPTLKVRPPIKLAAPKPTIMQFQLDKQKKKIKK